MDTLRGCLKPSSLRQALKELPKTLDDTYARILQHIPEEHQTEAQIIFNLLAFSTRPISLGEAAEAVAIDLEHGTFDRQDRLRDPSSILEICSSLVTLMPFALKEWEWDKAELAQDDSSNELRFAHFSVKEYLLSNRQKDDQTIVVREDSAHQQVSRLCLIYLLSIDEYVPSRAFKELPYLKYASRNWYVHSQRIQLSHNATVVNLLSALFKRENVLKLHTVLKMHNPDPEIQVDFTRLYLASFLGFAQICEELLREHNEVQQGVLYESQEEIARTLLQSGTDVNAQGGYHGNALQAASSGGHEESVRLLLQSGADVNAQGGSDGNALQAASSGGHEEIVRLLLQSGADVNAQGGSEGNALQAALVRP